MLVQHGKSNKIKKKFIQSYTSNKEKKMKQLKAKFMWFSYRQSADIKLHYFYRT